MIWIPNEEENKFLAAVDLENVNVTNKVDTATVEKVNRSTKVNKHGFVNQKSSISLRIISQGQCT